MLPSFPPLPSGNFVLLVRTLTDSPYGVAWLISIRAGVHFLTTKERMIHALELRSSPRGGAWLFSNLERGVHRAMKSSMPLRLADHLANS
jgi:hypothetical protein